MSPYTPAPGQNPAPLHTSDERNWAMLCHLSALLGFVLVPSANIFAPLIVWLVKRNDSPFIDEHGRESVNFHLSLWIYGLVSSLLIFTVVLIPLVFLIWGAIYLGGLVYSIIAGLKASNGEHFRYPLTMRLIS